MRIVVFGPSGMLGKRVVKALTISGHTPVPVYRRTDLLNRANIKHILEEADGVINCAGVIAVRNPNVLDMIYVNSMFPHVLCEVAAPRPVVLVSTDCVFSGRNRYDYKTTDICDPRDYYGKSKALGEVMAPNAIVVRTSFIGCEHGFMNMVLSAGQLAKTSEMQVSIDGWKNAIWTGSTAQAVARQLIDMLEQPAGIHHLSTETSISKYDLAIKLIEHYKLDVVVKPQIYPTYNRALIPTTVLQDIDTALVEYECGPVAIAA